MNVYKGGFGSWNDVLRETGMDLGTEPDRVYAVYDDGGWDGSAAIVWKRGDEWFATQGSHCSCFGLNEGMAAVEGFDPSLWLEAKDRGRSTFYVFDNEEFGAWLRENMV